EPMTTATRARMMVLGTPTASSSGSMAMIWSMSKNVRQSLCNPSGIPRPLPCCRHSHPHLRGDARSKILEPGEQVFRSGGSRDQPLRELLVADHREHA